MLTRREMLTRRHAGGLNDGMMPIGPRTGRTSDAARCGGCIEKFDLSSDLIAALRGGVAALKAASRRTCIDLLIGKLAC
jgi:hypothetical protein